MLDIDGMFTANCNPLLINSGYKSEKPINMDVCPILRAKLIMPFAPMRGPIFFDRGIPDLLAYAKHFGVDMASIHSACQQYKYRTDVFFMPAWEKIYTQDEERRMSFKETHVFGNLTHTSYSQAGYKIINMPLGSVNTRLDFILSRGF